ncbi:hypothetical protein O1611_g1810 [Lasiodiplodia mahajangana]|uniref:Uncharacterized protein n=1 Tax=Lasiodiplodia mahajangana TaxID=1108764 RepID=A0ACC2JWB3_9PEZI|nr:hypothetical protein O1611_g1810 [Lasiodiplodia mahajangana]
MADDSQGHFDPRPTDIFVAVMGMTGSGKSTFISLCTSQPVEVGHSLQAYIYMIDTPGFDDTNRSDTDVLKDIATWLTESYEENIRLSGMLYMHRITDTRMGGSAKKNLFMFKKLCGPNAMDNILLVTTMWENVDPAAGNKREEELIETTDFWGVMLQQGASIERHQNNHDSAMRLLAHFVNKKTITMAIQSEMVNDNKMLHETTAGQELDSVLEEQRVRFQKELEDTKEMFRQAQEQHDQESAEQLREHREKMIEKLEQIRREREELKVNMQKMHESSAKGAKRVKELEKKLECQERIIQDLRDSTLGGNKRIQSESEELKADMQKMHESRAKGAKKVQELEKKVEYQERTIRDLRSLRLGGNALQRLTSSAVASNQNRILESTVRISLVGSRYAFVGPARNYLSCPGEVPNVGGSDVYITMGTKFSWYRHAHVNGNCSANFVSEYPGLYAWIEPILFKHCCPTQVTLGPDGTYFVRIGSQCAYNLPSTFKAEEANFHEIRRLWLGFGGAYVIERVSGSKRINLKGHYKGLETNISHGCKTIKDLAMNIESPAYYAIIMTDAASASQLGPMPVRSAWEEYMTVNFAAKWD